MSCLVLTFMKLTPRRAASIMRQLLSLFEDTDTHMKPSSEGPTVLCAHPESRGLQDARYFTPNAWSFRDSYYVFVGDTWNIPVANDADHISRVKAASAALKPYVAGNYINCESLCTVSTESCPTMFLGGGWI